MASFTSVKDGDWDDPTVWGNLAGGEYPGKTTDEDTVDIASGDTVNYNIDNSSGGTNHRMGNITINGNMTFDTTMSTYLWIRGHLDPSNYNVGITIGSYASPLSSSYTCTVEYDLASAGSHDWLATGGDNDSVFDIHGAAKTQRAETSTSSASAQKDIVFSTIPADWAVGDRLIILSSSETTTGRYTETEEDTIASISSNTATMTNNLTYTHSAGTVILNMTRNIKFFATSSTLQPNSAGGNFKAQVENVEFQYIGNDGFMEGTGSNASPSVFYGCTWSGTNGYIMSCDSDEAGNWQYCNFYNTGTNIIKGQNRTGSMTWEGCVFVDTVSQVDNSTNRATKWKWVDCIFACNRTNVLYPHSHDIELSGCYFYGNYGYSIYPRESNARLTACVFGEREDGTSQTNLSASIRVYDTMTYCNDCKFSDASILSSHESDPRMPTLYSSNHDQTAGAYRVWSGNGTLLMTDEQTTYRTSAPSLKISPEQSASTITHKFQFKADASTSYTISVYGKRSVTGWDYDPYMRVFGCGLSDTQYWSTDNTSWNEVTITGTTDRAGIVEVEVTAMDNGGDFYIDDITVT